MPRSRPTTLPIASTAGAMPASYIQPATSAFAAACAGVRYTRLGDPSEAPVLLLGAPREGSAPLQDAPRHSAPRPRTDYTCPGPPTGLARARARQQTASEPSLESLPGSTPCLSISLSFACEASENTQDRCKTLAK